MNQITVDGQMPKRKPTIKGGVCEMGDLISRIALLEEFEWLKENTGTYNHAALDEHIQRIKNAPTVDAEPVRHGRWIMRGGYIRCSECDAKTLWKDTGGTGGFSHEYEQVRSVHCHNCGAKMDGEHNDVQRV